MASFLPVNNSTPEDHPMDGATTPRATSNGAPASPAGSAPELHPDVNSQTVDRGAEGQAVSSHTRTSSTATDDPMHDDSEDGTDQEGEPGGSGPPSKKKKGQRFFCTDFPPCNLSFTRSEHLARHIRKHTGERPFQCHCSRRFSRLDNLRQHAQTVHVNEEIPGDSLAATGTRFQRQVRTDRVRPPARVRAGTVGSQGGHSRGHSRNLSTSSITSTGSTYSQPQELRRRPPPLIMANDPTSRSRLPLDAMGEPPTTPPGQVRGGAPFGSPYTPSVFSTGAGSPHQFQSPMSATRRGFWDGKTASRRLSVPTGSNPFMTQHGPAYPPSYTTSPASSAFPTSAGVFPSPTSTNYSVSRDENTLSAAEAEMRRRTWHPSTYSGFARPATSGLSNYPAPDTIPAPLSGNGSSEQTTRLPGIESFDKVVSQHRPLTPPTRKASPMQIDSHHRPPPPPSHGFGSGYTYNQPGVRPPPPMSGPGHRRGHVSWDMSLHTGITGLDIRDRNSSRDWSQQTIAELQNVSSRPSSSYQPSLGPMAEKSPEEQRSHHHCTHSFSSANRPTRTSPEDSSSSESVHTPSAASIEYHPAIVHSSGYVEPHESSLPSDHSAPPICGRRSSNADGYRAPPAREPRSEMFPDPSARNAGMGRLEALVAVATSENKGAAKLFL